MGSRYRVLKGLNYPPFGRGGKERRVEPDTIVDDLPTSSIQSLLDLGAIEPADVQVAVPAAVVAEAAPKKGEEE